MANTPDTADIGANPFLSNIHTDSPDSAEEGDLLGTINHISEATMHALQEESLPPLPTNYQLFFEKFLEKENPIIKEKIRHIMNLQSDIQHRTLVFEKAVGESLKIIKRVLKSMSIVYQNFVISQNVANQYIKDIEQAESKLVFRNIMELFSKDISKIIAVTSKQLDQIRNLHIKTDKNLKQLSQNSVYDLTLDVYNKHYFISLLQKEQQLCTEFNHSSVLMYVALSRSITTEVGQDTQTFMSLLRTMAKFLQKHIQTSSCITYIDEGTFGVLLRYSDVLEAQELAIMLFQVAQTTDVFIADVNIQLDITSSIAKISAERTIEETMSACRSTLNIALDEKQHCKIYQQDNIADADS